MKRDPRRSLPAPRREVPVFEGDLEAWLGAPDGADRRLCYVHVTYPNGEVMSLGSDRRTLYVGRGAANEVVLRHPQVAPRHLLIRHLESGFEVTDLGSVAGTRWRGERLAPHQSYAVAEGEALQLGPLEIRLEEVVDGVVVESEGAVADSLPVPAAAGYASDDRPQRRRPRAEGGEPWTLWAAGARAPGDTGGEAGGWPLPVRFGDSSGADPSTAAGQPPAPGIGLLQGLAIATVFFALVFLLAIVLF